MRDEITERVVDRLQLDAAIGDSPEQAETAYERTVAALDEEAGR